MALRLALRRLSGNSPKELTNRSIAGEVASFSPRTFFEETNFWNKAHLGPFVLLLVFTPTIYRSIKDFYWTRQLRKLNTEEIISDRYEWLRVNMIQDEVDAVLVKQKIPEPLILGSATPP